jgi:hypothetical protein
MAALLPKMERIREALGLDPAPIPTLIAQANAHLELSLRGGFIEQADLILQALFGTAAPPMAPSPDIPAAAMSVTVQLGGLDLSGRASTPPSPVPVEPPHLVETPGYALSGADDDYGEAAELEAEAYFEEEREPMPERMWVPPPDHPEVPPAPMLRTHSPVYGSSTRTGSSVGPATAEYPPEQEEPCEQEEQWGQGAGRRRRPDDGDSSAAPSRPQSPAPQEEEQWSGVGIPSAGVSGSGSGRGAGRGVGGSGRGSGRGDGRGVGRGGGRGGRGAGAPAAPGTAPHPVRSQAEAYMQAYTAARASQDAPYRVAAARRGAFPVSTGQAPRAVRAPPSSVPGASAAERRANNLGKAGDEFWDCGKCATKNWARRDTCRKCKMARPAAVQLKTAEVGMPGVRAAGGGDERVRKQQLTGASLAAVIPAPQGTRGSARSGAAGPPPVSPTSIAAAVYGGVPVVAVVQGAVRSPVMHARACPSPSRYAHGGRWQSSAGGGCPPSMGYAQQAIYSVQPAHVTHPGAQAGGGYDGYGGNYGEGYDGYGNGYGGGYVGSAQASPSGYAGQPRIASALVVSYEDDEVIEYANTEAHGGHHHHRGYSDA